MINSGLQYPNLSTVQINHFYKVYFDNVEYEFEFFWNLIISTPLPYRSRLICCRLWKWVYNVLLSGLHNADTENTGP